MKAEFTITGPGVHETRQTGEIGLSFAITCASHAAKGRIEARYYVADRDGNVVGRADSHADATVSIYGREHHEQRAA